MQGRKLNFIPGGLSPSASGSLEFAWLRRRRLCLQLVADLSEQVFPPRNVRIGFDAQR